MIQLSPEAEETLEELAEIERRKKEMHEFINKGEEVVSDSFRATDHLGRPSGLSIGEIRHSLAG